MRADAARRMKPLEGNTTRAHHGTSAHLDDESLGAYVDGELRGWAEEAAADHLRTCSECREAAGILAALGSAVRRLEVPEWDIEAMVALVDAGISGAGAGACAAAGAEDSAVAGAGAGAEAGRASVACESRRRTAWGVPRGSYPRRIAAWISSRRRLALGLGIAVTVLVVSALGLAGVAYRRELTAQDKFLVDSHYIVRSGNAGALLVSYPGR